MSFELIHNLCIQFYLKAESSKLYWVGAALLFISFLFVLMSLDFFNLRIVNDVPLALATGAAVLQGLCVMNDFAL